MTIYSLDVLLFLFGKKLLTLFLASCSRTLSGGGEQGLPVLAVHGRLVDVASLFAERGLRVHGLQQWQRSDPAVVLSCPPAGGTFPDQGPYPRPLHRHQGEESTGNPLQYSCLEPPMDGGPWTEEPGRL